MAPGYDLTLLRLGDRTIDMESRQIRWEGGSSRLTPIEAALVRYLAERTTEFIEQEQLLLDVWGYNARVRTRTVVATVHRLRAKIEPDPKQPRYLVRNHRGYRLIVKPVSSPPSADPTPELPRWSTPWVDRGTLLEQLAAHDGNVVLWGISGAGKTRLAARRAAAAEGWSVQFVDLSEATSLAEAIDRIARCCRLTLGAQHDAMALALADRGPTLLVLDACEDLAEAVPALVESCQHHAENVRLILTSRVSLDIPGALHLEVGALTLESSIDLLTTLTDNQDPGWSGRASPDQLRGVVDAVDRLPLAIELAAGHARLLQAGELQTALESDRTQLLGRQTGIERALHSAWADLEPIQQQMLARCACFWGPFTVETALATLRDGGGLATLRELVSRSLIQVEHRVVSGRTRYRLLNAVRAHALRHLTPEERAAARRALLDWYTELAKKASTTQFRESVFALEPEFENLRGALAELGPDAPPDRGWLLVAMAAFRKAGPVNERLLKRVTAWLARADLPTLLRCHFLLCEYAIWQNIDRSKGAPAIREAMALAAGDPRLELHLELVREGWSTNRVPERLDELVARARAEGHAGLVINALRIRGMSRMSWYQSAEALVDLTEAAEISERLGHALSGLDTQRLVARCLVDAGRYDEAIGLLEELRDTCATHAWVGPLGLVLRTLGRAYEGAGRREEAVRTGLQGIRQLTRTGMVAFAATSAGEIGLLLSDLQRRDEAWTQYTWSQTHVERLGFRDARIDLPIIGLARLEVDGGELDLARHRLEAMPPCSDWGRGARLAWLGICFALEGELERALSSLQSAREPLTASRILPWLHLSNAFLGAVERRLGRDDEARKTVEEARRWFATNRVSHGIALCALALGDRSEAADALDLRVMRRLIGAGQP